MGFTLPVRGIWNEIITVLVGEVLQSSVWAHHSHLKSVFIASAENTFKWLGDWA